ncbi:hypothetical protein CSKR_107148 [Clonorchis sinensis]|uniref:Uncharacterized protein n=1 Tax=Clonorchis sinensis TaxID=79923 RepID=A0A419QD51_CLOSI|nr:hypothetical protein CSKR_107148 [Clonorchis sinensis]
MPLLFAHTLGRACQVHVGKYDGEPVFFVAQRLEHPSGTRRPVKQNYFRLLKAFINELPIIDCRFRTQTLYACCSNHRSMSATTTLLFKIVRQNVPRFRLAKCNFLPKDIIVLESPWYTVCGDFPRVTFNIKSFFYVFQHIAIVKQQSHHHYPNAMDHHVREVGCRYSELDDMAKENIRYPTRSLLFNVAGVTITKYASLPKDVMRIAPLSRQTSTSQVTVTRGFPDAKNQVYISLVHSTKRSVYSGQARYYQPHGLR